MHGCLLGARAELRAAGTFAFFPHKDLSSVENGKKKEGLVSEESWRMLCDGRFGYERKGKGKTVNDLECLNTGQSGTDRLIFSCYPAKRTT